MYILVFFDDFRGARCLEYLPLVNELKESSFFGASKKELPWSCIHVNISLKELRSFMGFEWI